ncbi:aminobenzoyl-glutamate transport protein [Clostridium sp. CAG:1000]|jgi:aminobenzoyl-glutamate transport protein|nr:aminobenzoyl-glutamate transport protein [Clostridium sp. CAG:1000]
MFKKKVKLSPIMTFIIMTIIVIVLSGFLHLLNIQAEYSTVNTVSNEVVNNVIEVENLFSTSGIKHIVTSAVNGFVNFEPLATLIIILIGLGILEKTGFMRSFFTILTRNSKRNTVTFILIFICLLFSILGNSGFVIMLPIAALLFKYGRRNPLGGIIASFASLSFGYGINVFLSSNDSSLLTLTINAAKTLDPKYKIGIFFALFIMIVLLIAISVVFTYITEKKVMPKLPRYESDEEVLVITNKELRGLIIGLGLGIIYTLLIIYMIIPGLPLSGAFLDHSGERYIDMIFGNNSLFAKGFIFIVTFAFFLIGIGYGFMTKTIKNNKDVTDSLGHSLDDIGSIIVLIFFASLFINVYEESHIGLVITGFISSLIGSLNFTGIGLILITLICIAIANIFCPSSIVKWSMLSSVIVPLFMNASISPEFSQLVYVAGDSITNGLTPLFMYFVIYIAFMEKYNKGEMVTLFGSIKTLIPYSVYSLIIWAIVLVGFYLIGIPIGIGSYPGVVYGT